MLGKKLNKMHLLSLGALLGLHVGLLKSMDDGGAAAAAAPAAVPSVRYSWGLYAHKGFESSLQTSYSAIERSQWVKPDQAFFAIYDGHGRKDASNYANHNLHHKFSENIKLGLDVPASFVSAFPQVDLEIQNKFRGIWTTAHCAYIDRNQLYLAWAGDGCMIVIKGGARVAFYKNLSHTLGNPDERKRIEDLGFTIIKSQFGFPEGIKDPRRNFSVRNYVTRFLGNEVIAMPDFKAKDLLGAIIATPEIQSLPLENGDIVILASPVVGFWLGQEGILRIVRGVLEGQDNQSIINSRKAEIPSAEERAMFERVLARGLAGGVEDGNNASLIRIAELLRNISFAKARSSKNQDPLSKYCRTQNVSALAIRINVPGAPERERPKIEEEGKEGACELMIDRLIEFRDILKSSGYERSGDKVQEILSQFSHGQCKSTDIPQLIEDLLSIPEIMRAEKGTTTIDVSVVLKAVTTFINMNRQFLPK
jgi:serine/threonine protein phosphatase PrpC